MQIDDIENRGGSTLRKIERRISLVLLGLWPIAMLTMVMAGDEPPEKRLAMVLYQIAYYLLATFPVSVIAPLAAERLFKRLSRMDVTMCFVWAAPLAIMAIVVLLVGVSFNT